MTQIGQICLTVKQYFFEEERHLRVLTIYMGKPEIRLQNQIVCPIPFLGSFRKHRL